MKVLVLGDGLLGSELVNNYKWDMVSRKTGTLDITFLGLNELESTIKQYDVIVNCISNTDSYSEDKQKHWEVNYEFVKNLNNICSNKIKLVQISTEFVYAHNSIPPTEKCLPLPDNTWYAYTKLLADEYIQVSNSNYLICRVLHKPNSGIYDYIWDPILTSGDKVNKIAVLIYKLVINKAKGVYNVGTGDKLLSSLYPNIPTTTPPPKTPKDTRMDINKLNKFLKQHYGK